MNRHTLLVVGSAFPYSEIYPKEGEARAVQINIQPRKSSLRYPMEVNLHVDTNLNFKAFIPLLNKKG